MSSIELNKVSVTYTIKQAHGRGEADTVIKAVDQISLKVSAGERVGVIGRNGGGKSTLLSILSGNLLPHSGSVSVDGQRLSLLNRASGLIPEASLYENAKIKAYSFGLAGNDVKSYIEAVMTDSGLQSRSGSSLNSLSTGMSGKFNIALNSQIIKPITILDEWVGTLDVSDANNNDLLNRLVNEADLVVLASHNETLIRQLCNRVILLEQGQVIYDGNDFNKGFQYLEIVKRLNSSGKYSNEELKPLMDEYVYSSNGLPSESSASLQSLGQRTKLHFLNMGRSSIPSLKNFLSQLYSSKYELIFHDQSKALREIPFGEKICCIYRDPVQRFISGFYSRKMLGQPLFDVPWTEQEKVTFSHFDTPDQLAKALGSDNPQKKEHGLFAMKNTGFLNKNYGWWLGDKSLLDKRKEDFLLIGDVSDITNILSKLSTLLDIKVEQEFVDLDEREVAEQDFGLSGDALSNLKSWYKEDYELLRYLQELKK